MGVSLKSGSCSNSSISHPHSLPSVASHYRAFQGYGCSPLQDFSQCLRGEGPLDLLGGHGYGMNQQVMYHQSTPIFLTPSVVLIYLYYLASQFHLIWSPRSPDCSKPTEQTVRAVSSCCAGAHNLNYVHFFMPPLESFPCVFPWFLLIKISKILQIFCCINCLL